MNSASLDPFKIPAVRVSRWGAAKSGAAQIPPAPCLGSPKLWLGAKSPFGLALPAAHPSASTMYAPRGVWLDDERLIVCDTGNHRVLIWNELPATDQSPADLVLGQIDFDSEGPASAGRGPENGFYLPTGVIVIGEKLIIADAWHHRLLVWNDFPQKSQTPPDYAIGQPDLSRVEVNRRGSPSLESMNWPFGVAWIDEKLYVADTGNRRVLGWNGFPEKDRPADFLLGQSTPSASEENRGAAPSGRSFRWPHAFAQAGGVFFIADAGNHRVLGWKKPPTGDEPANFVIGQRDFSSAYEFPYDAQGPRRLRFPYAICGCDAALAVADTANNRILFYKAPPTQNAFAEAFDVVGQIDFAANGENHWRAVGKSTLCWPYGVAFHQGTLAVADSGNNRVMLWDCKTIFDLS